MTKTERSVPRRATLVVVLLVGCDGNRADDAMRPLGTPSASRAAQLQPAAPAASTSSASSASSAASAAKPAATTSQPVTAPREEWSVWSRYDYGTGQYNEFALDGGFKRCRFRLSCSTRSMKVPVELEGVVEVTSEVYYYRSKQCSLRFEYSGGMTIRELGPCRLPGKRCSFNGLYGPEERPPPEALPEVGE